MQYNVTTNSTIKIINIGCSSTNKIEKRLFHIKLFVDIQQTNNIIELKSFFMTFLLKQPISMIFSNIKTTWNREVIFRPKL